MKIGVSVDITKAVAALDNLAKTQVPFAASKALNEAAQKVVEAEQREMRDVFDRPKPYTLNSLRVRLSAHPCPGHRLRLPCVGRTARLIRLPSDHDQSPAAERTARTDAALPRGLRGGACRPVRVPACGL